MKRRLFVGLPVSRALADMCAVLRNRTTDTHPEDQRFRWIEPENYHITVCFIGWAQLRWIPILNKAIRKVTDVTHPLTLLFHGFSWVPDKNPRMIWATFRNNSGYETLVTRIATSVEGSIPENTRRHIRIQKDVQIIPHITLARVKNIREPFELPASKDIMQESVRLCNLYESRLTSGGAVYTTLKQYMLSETVVRVQ